MIGRLPLRPLCLATALIAAALHGVARAEEPITVAPLAPPAAEGPAQGAAEDSGPPPPPENRPESAPESALESESAPQSPPVAEPSFEESLRRLIEEGRKDQAGENKPDADSLPPPSIARNGATLRGLDKITAQIRTFDAPLDRPVAFGRLTITLRACKERPPEEPPESAAFLEIDETPPGEATRRVFSGWMFASSPGLSALEHPVYDVWVLHCTTVSPDTSSASE